MTTEITTSRITVGSLGAYLARPKDGDNGAGMLLLPMVTGISAELREFADDIARSGTTALSWDPWHGPSLDDMPREELFPLMAKLDDAEVRAEQVRLLDHMFGELGLRKVGVIGWCMGGRYALLLGAADQRPANVVAYHPTVPIPPAPNHTLDAAEQAARITAPVMMLYPGADDLVPRESFDNLQAALQSRDSAATITHIYPGAQHGFTASGRRNVEANANAYHLSWPQVIAFVDATTKD